jgi:hypothetical protein
MRTKRKAIAIIDQDHVLIRSWLLPPADGVFGSDRPLPGFSYPNSELVDACSAEILKPQVAAAK